MITLLGHIIPITIVINRIFAVILIIQHRLFRLNRLRHQEIERFFVHNNHFVLHLSIAICEICQEPMQDPIPSQAEDMYPLYIFLP